MFTRVLKGHIAVDSRVFPVGTPGCLLDTFARSALWEVGKNYNHGNIETAYTIDIFYSIKDFAEI